MNEDLDDKGIWRATHRRAIAMGKQSELEPWFVRARGVIASVLEHGFAHKGSCEDYEQAGLIIGWALEPLREALASIEGGAEVEGLTDIAFVSDWQPQLEWLWGCAVANVALAFPSDCAVVWYLVENRSIAQEALVQVLTAELSTANRAAVLAVMEGLVKRITTHPEAGVYKQERAGFLQILTAWRRKKLIESVWRDPLGQVLWWYQPLALLRVLRRTDPARFLASLEDMGFPVAVTQEIRGIEDIGEILDLLRVAPNVRLNEGDGRLSWNGKLTAPLLLGAVLERVERFVSPGATEEEHEALDQRARAIFTETARVLLSRQDGVFLGIQWLAHLIGDEFRQAGRNWCAWSPVRTTMTVLAEALATSGIGLPQVLAVFHRILPAPANLDAMRQSGLGENERGWVTTATDAFLAAVLMEQDDSRPHETTAGPALIELYRSLLIRRDQGLYIFSDGEFPTWRQWQPAWFFVAGDDPVGRWCEGWNVLAEQRRRGRHGSDDFKCDEPSFFHMCLGMTLVDWLLFGKPPRPAEALACWEVVFDALFSTSLTLTWTRADQWRHALAKLFARLPHATGAGDIVPIAERLLRLGGDDELLTWCTSMVLANGVEPKKLTIGLSEVGMSLPGRLAAFVEWELRPETRRQPSPLATEAKRILDRLVEG